MASQKDAKIIPLSNPTLDKEGAGSKVSDSSVKLEGAYLYTLGLLMEDFGKEHKRGSCVLCEPMKSMGMHRDEIIIKLVQTLFTTFFPSFEDYWLGLKENLLEGLMSRKKGGKAYDSLQAKLKDLLQEQIEKDVRDFFGDIKKHLQKYAQVEIGESREEKIIAASLEGLKGGWMKEAH